ncbi:MAG: DUF3786 domain-containing protein [Syntrophobacteraceae bacterium]|nr:DUF3786 domain-containing protein [Syntrophobacteraceae bacterium]
MSELETRYVKVHTLSNRFEADVIIEALKQEGIPVIVRPFMDTAYSNIFVHQKGWGHILAPGEKADLAREIIAELSEVEGGEEEPEDSEEPQTDPVSPSFERIDPEQKLDQVVEQLGDLQLEPRLWDALRLAEPREVASRTLARFDPEKKVYTLTFLNTAIMCRPQTAEIEVAGLPEDFSRDFQLGLALLHYLLHGRNTPRADKWVSEKDLPGGSLFFTAAHVLPMDSLVAAFDGRPGLLDTAARSIGGEKTDTAGISYRFTVLPRIPFLLIFWERDEEFAPSCHLLFDETILSQLSSLDLIWALVNVFVRALLAAACVSRSQQPE